MLEQWQTAAAKDAPAMLAGRPGPGHGVAAVPPVPRRVSRRRPCTPSSDRQARPRREALPGGAEDRPAQARKPTAGLKVLAKSAMKGEIAPAKCPAAARPTGNIDRAGPGHRSSRPPSRPAAEAGTMSNRRRRRSRQAQAERAVQEQQFRVLVDETIRRGRRCSPPTRTRPTKT